jgi:hypothetical protein
LYHGTNEGIAKVAPSSGIDAKEIVLTTCYSPYQAFRACSKRNERWAIVELVANRLYRLRPHPELKGRSKRTWQKSLDVTGLCIHEGPVPSFAVSKVWIYNPESNWLITRAVIHTNIGNQTQRKALEVVNRWLTGEFIMIDEWLGEQKEVFTKEQKDNLGNSWGERSGLDLFYQGS